MRVDEEHRRARWTSLEKALQNAELDAVLITHLPSVRYLTGFSGSSGVVFCSRFGTPVLITDFRYQEQAASEVAEPVRVHVSKNGWISALADFQPASGVRRAGFEPEHLTVLDRDRLSERVPGIEWIAARHLMAGLRAVKDDGEIERIQAAARLAEAALDRVISRVAWRSGPTELEVASALELELRRAGSGPLPFDVIVAGGARTSLPHAMPSDRAVGTGDLLLLDFGATVHGYCCDMTRTFVIGRAADWQRDIHAHVLAAQERALGTIGPGVPAVSVDRAARDVLAARDLDGFFGHSTGHGIGLEVHEEPRLSSTSDDVLEPGNVVTVEPGVYLPGRGGVRIEDDVAVTQAGFRILTSAPRDLIEL